MPTPLDATPQLKFQQKSFEPLLLFDYRAAKHSFFLLEIILSQQEEHSSHCYLNIFGRDSCLTLMFTPSSDQSPLQP
jgi:hypothetical protein